MNTDAIHEATARTLAGKLVFPEMVRMLMEAGVESYFADLASGRETFYAVDGGTHAEELTLPTTPIGGAYSEFGLTAAVRAAQADTVRYPEFVRLAKAAGVMGYRVFLTGKRVVYLGRKGEIHVEEFPRPKA